MRNVKNAYHCLFGFLLSISIVQVAEAQKDSSQIIQKSKEEKRILALTLGIQHGFIFAHSPAVENTKGAKPTGVEFLISWRKSDAEVWNLCNCFPANGLLLAYYDYDSEILGRSYTAAYSLEPAYRIGKRSLLYLRLAAGFSYLTNPYDSIKNPSNASYSTFISQYLLLGLGLSFPINEQWRWNLTANYQHESNGGLKQPNKGINWPTAGLSVSYEPNPRPYYRGTRQKDKSWKSFGPRWEVATFGVARRIVDSNGQKQRLPLVGLSVLGSKQIGTINALTLGAEAFTDHTTKRALKLDSIDGSPIRAGIFFGHEFLLGKFLFSQRIGVYIFDQSPYFDPLYHRWGIQYQSKKHWGFGFNLLAHKQVADFVDVRVIYSWQRKDDGRQTTDHTR